MTFPTFQDDPGRDPGEPDSEESPVSGHDISGATLRLLNVRASSTRLYYIDESYDDRFFCLSALGVKLSSWKEAFERVERYRTELRGYLGVPIEAEIHARDLVRGRGRLSDRLVTKWSRSKILFELLSLAASLPDVHVVNVCADRQEKREPELGAWRRMLNALNGLCEQAALGQSLLQRSMAADRPEAPAHEHVENLVESLMDKTPPRTTRAILIADPSREAQVSRVTKKFSVREMIQGEFELWREDVMGHIPLTQSIEGVYFQKSARSHFIQLVDCIAYALLKKQAPASRQIKKYGIDKAFDKCIREACVTPGLHVYPDGIMWA
jgi:hypothetical protein